MLLRNLGVLIICGLLSLSCQQSSSNHELAVPQKLDRSQRITRIAFGSCNRQNLNQPLWDDIQQFDPQLWIWTGDNIYGDTEDMQVMREKYNRQLREEPYRTFASETNVIGIWDDHDYGANDAGKEYPAKQQSLEEMYRFLGVPDSAVRRDHTGAYGSYTFGPEDKEVKVILLDTRHFRDSLEPNRGSNQRYKPNTEGTLLGEQQWTWLQKELSNSDAEVHLIVSGIQIIPEEHAFEKWANFPNERKRLFDLIASTKPALPILISGDRHIAEISAINLSGMDHRLYEITSSGMTHAYEGIEEQGESNRYRVDGPIGRLNYGQLEIDWNSEPINVVGKVAGDDKQVYLEQELN